MIKPPVARKLFETPNVTRWTVKWPSTAFREGRTYIASTYPESDLIYIETAARHRAVSGAVKMRVEPVIRDALRRAGWGA